MRTNHSDFRRHLVYLWFLLVPGTLLDVAPGVAGLDLDDDHVMTRRFNPGLGSGRLLGTSKMLDNDDRDDSDFILSTNVLASSSVGGLSRTPGLVGGASLLSTGPGSVSASLGGTYDFLGTGGGLGLPPIYGLSDDDLDLDLDLDLDDLDLDIGFGGRRFFKTPRLFSRRTGLGSGLRGFKPASLGPRLTYVSPRKRRPFFGGAKRRYRPRFKPFGRRRKNFWWKGRRPRLFRRKFRPMMKWRKKFPFFG